MKRENAILFNMKREMRHFIPVIRDSDPPFTTLLRGLLAFKFAYYFPDFLRTNWNNLSGFGAVVLIFLSYKYQIYKNRDTRTLSH